jgi:succinate-semialdehyde dehydrogenase/glutarate-semialdehyde dehydrogenase
MKLISTNPAKNYKVLGEVEISSEEEIKRKVTEAQDARKKWKSLGVKGRVELLRNVSRGISNRQEEFALLSTREMGMPITQSRQDVKDAVNYFNWYLDHAGEYVSPEITKKENGIVHRVLYEPIGVAAVIVPWNFPASNFVWGAGQNLIVGNTVVFKDSEETPLVGKLIEEIIARAGVPKGVFSEVYGGGKVGDFLVHEDIDLISFTGSTKVGRHLYAVAAEKLIKIIMELGGSAPGIVFEDANVDEVLENIYFNRFINCGQACDALKRLIVHKDRFEEVVEKLKKKLQSVKIGDPESESTDVGPLVAKRQLELVEEQIADAKEKGAKVVIGGKRPHGLAGAYCEPTMLTQVTKNMRVWQEEVFAPVLPIVSFTTEEEAVQLANDTKYGLGSYIFTEDKRKAKRVASQIEAGMVAVNNVSYIQPCNPFGGYKESGIGREHGKYGFRELTQIKVVSMEE